MYKLLIAFLAFTLSISGCAKGPKPQKLLPARGEILTFLKTKQIREDKDLAESMNIEELNSDLKEMNLSLGSFPRIIAFASFSPRRYSGVILQGDHIAAGKIKRQVEKEGWEEGRYSKDKYFRAPSSGQCLVTLNGLLVLGSEEAVRDILDVYRGRKQGKSSDPIYIRLTGSMDPESAPVVSYIIPSQKLLDMGRVVLEGMKLILDVFKIGSIGRLLGKIGLVKGMAMSIDRSGENFPMRMICLMQSETAASLASGSLNLLKGVTTLLPSQKMSEQDKENLAVFQSMEISHEKEVLKIEMIIPRRELLTP